MIPNINTPIEAKKLIVEVKHDGLETELAADDEDDDYYGIEDPSNTEAAGNHSKNYLVSFAAASPGAHTRENHGTLDLAQQLSELKI
jgi:hypothetical protein